MVKQTWIQYNKGFAPSFPWLKGVSMLQWESLSDGRTTSETTSYTFPTSVLSGAVSEPLGSQTSIPSFFILHTTTTSSTLSVAVQHTPFLSDLVFFCVSALRMAMLVQWSSGLSTCQQPLARLPLILVLIVLVSRGSFLLILLIAWPFLWCHCQVKMSPY